MIDEQTRREWTEQAIERSVRFPNDLEMWLNTARICGCRTCFCCFVRQNEYEIRQENNRQRIEIIRNRKGA